jgi:hypothetical protein
MPLKYFLGRTLRVHGYGLHKFDGHVSISYMYVIKILYGTHSNEYKKLAFHEILITFIYYIDDLYQKSTRFLRLKLLE